MDTKRTPEQEEIIREAMRLLGSAKSEKKTEAARENAKKGGWPKGKPRKQQEEERTEQTNGTNKG